MKEKNEEKTIKTAEELRKIVEEELGKFEKVVSRCGILLNDAFLDKNFASRFYYDLTNKNGLLLHVYVGKHTMETFSICLFKEREGFEGSFDLVKEYKTRPMTGNKSERAIRKSVEKAVLWLKFE